MTNKEIKSLTIRNNFIIHLNDYILTHITYGNPKVLYVGQVTKINDDGSLVILKANYHRNRVNNAQIDVYRKLTTEDARYFWKLNSISKIKAEEYFKSKKGFDDV